MTAPQNDPMWALRPENQPYSQEREDRYKAEFPYLSMSPEEYVARHGHLILCFSLHRFKYHDERLKDWLQRVFDLLTKDRERIPSLRKQYLSADKLAEVENVIARQEEELEDLPD
jgi:hypothetical protein